MLLPCVTVVEAETDNESPAYSTNKALLADGAGRRLENFFWRIWGSEHILNTVNGSQVAVLFNAISEEGPLRTTPTQSPRTSRHIGSYTRTPPRSPNETRAESRLTTLAGNSENGRSSEPSEIQEREQDVEGPSLPLEQTTPAQASRSTEALSDVAQPAEALRYKINTEDEGDDSTPTATPPSTARRSEPPRQHPRAVGASDVLSRHGVLRADRETLPAGSAESSSTVRSASSEDTIKGNQESTRRTGRKRATFHANTPANRRRPAIMRRKSSQSSSSAASSAASSRPSVKSASENNSTEPADEPETISRRSSDMRPVTLAEEDRSTDDARQPSVETSARSTSPHDNNPSKHQQKGALVEPDFRSKFVAKTRSAQSSFVSLPSLLRKSSATTAASASYQAAGTVGSGHQMQPAGRAQARVTFSDEVAASNLQKPADSNVESDEGAQALPRTKSQLTLLLEKDRGRASGNEKGEKH